jgi:hypothetical protein
MYIQCSILVCRHDLDPRENEKSTISELLESGGGLSNRRSIRYQTGNRSRGVQGYLRINTSFAFLDGSFRLAAMTVSMPNLETDRGKR